MNRDLLVNERQEAQRLGISIRTLQTWRYKGGGPPFIKVGSAVRYDPASTDAWITERTRARTSDTGPAADENHRASEHAEADENHRASEHAEILSAVHAEILSALSSLSIPDDDAEEILGEVKRFSAR